MSSPCLSPLAFLALLLSGSLYAQEDDVADIASRDLRAGKDENKRYFLIGPHKDSKTPNEGYGLIVVLPGGDGGADFHAFVKRIYKYAVPESMWSPNRWR